MSENQISPGTQCIWAGEEEYLMQGATQVPIVNSVAYGYKDVDEWLQVALGERPGHIYSRNSNPTVHAFEEKVRQLEGAEAATSARDANSDGSEDSVSMSGSSARQLARAPAPVPVACVL